MTLSKRMQYYNDRVPSHFWLRAHIRTRAIDPGIDFARGDTPRMVLSPPPSPITYLWRQRFNMAAGGVREVIASSEFPVKLVKWNVRDGKEVREGSFLAFCQRSDEEERLDTAIRNLNVKSPFNGKIQKLLFAEGDVIPAR